MLSAIPITHVNVEVKYNLPPELSLVRLSHDPGEVQIHPSVVNVICTRLECKSQKVGYRLDPDNVLHPLFPQKFVIGVDRAESIWGCIRS